MKRTETTAKPFIKWAGGKGQLLGQLDEHLPSQLDGRPFTYVEPFVGGGAMLFHMLKKHPEIRRAVINDINDQQEQTNMEVAVQLEAINDALDQLRDTKATPRKPIGFKTTANKE